MAMSKARSHRSVAISLKFNGAFGLATSEADSEPLEGVAFLLLDRFAMDDVRLSPFGFR